MSPPHLVTRSPRRCPWAGTDPLYITYHDTEWGVPQHDDRHLFEMLVLEGAQAGLSWITILRKREAYKTAFDNFAIETVAGYSRRKQAALLRDPGDRPQPPQNRSRHQERSRGAGHHRRARQLRCVSLAVRRWATAREPVAVAGRHPAADAGVGCAQSRPPPAWRLLCRIDHLLCLHAGRWPRE